MHNSIISKAYKAPHNNNDNYPRVLCGEVFTPGVGWSVHIDRYRSGVERLSLDEFIGLIYLIENGARNTCYLDQARDMRACLERIQSFRVMS